MEVPSQKNRWIGLLPGLVGFLAICCITSFGCGLAGYLIGQQVSQNGSSDFWSGSTPTVGNPAPDFELISLKGETIRLSDFRGQPVLLNFWASWCGPCVIEMPAIQDRYQRYASNLVVLGVNLGESENTVRGFAEENELTFTILLDLNEEAEQLYRIDAIPTSYFIDSQGIIQSVWIGSMSEQTLDDLLLSVGIGK